MKRFAFAYLSILIFLFVPVDTMADILRVPAEYTTIQSAINAASASDTVLVSDGTYTGPGNRNIDPSGKQITVVSENGPETCIIDCMNSGRGFYFHNGENAHCVISGFTIINGNVEENGGGMYVDASPTIQNCIIRQNTAGQYGGGVYCAGSSTVPSLSNCRITDNAAGLFGGGLSCTGTGEEPSGVASISAMTSRDSTSNDQRASGPSVSISNSLIAGNQAMAGGGGISLYDAEAFLSTCVVAANESQENGAGMLLDNGSVADLSGCILAGNDGGQDGGGFFTGQRCQGIIQNSVVAGNRSDGRGGGIYGDQDATMAMTNSTLAGNAGTSGGGCFFSTDNDISLSNNIIDQNTGIAIYDNGVFSYSMLHNNLFGTNPDGDFWGINHGLFTGAVNIDMNVEYATNNHAGDPRFIMGRTNAWTAPPRYDPQTNRTTLYCDSETFLENELQDLFVQPNTANRLQSLITSNDIHTIVVVGDVSGWVHSGDTFQLIDYHLQDASAALDRGDPSSATMVDFDGDDRPGEDGLVDMGMDEADPAFLPAPDLIPPISEVLPLAAHYIANPVSIDYMALDGESSVATIQLYYRLNDGTWILYNETPPGEHFTFDTLITGGNGRYDFYTISVDQAGNIETAPEEPDQTTVIISSYPDPVIHVNLNATGLEIGTTWQDAFRSLTIALDVAETYHVTDIWVAEGEYHEAIDMRSGVSLYGGFTGTEESLDERDYTTHPTRINGQDSGEEEPAFHVVTFINTTQAYLDGFIITGGNAGGVYEDAYGGGIYCSLADDTNGIINCRIIGNEAMETGGGIYCGYSAIKILNCSIYANQSGMTGGGLGTGPNMSMTSRDMAITDQRVSGPGPSLTQTLIVGNDSGKGGGIFIGNTTLNLMQTRIVGNTALTGGGIHSSEITDLVSRDATSNDQRATGAESYLINTILAGNTAESGGAIFSRDSTLFITNCNIASNQANTSSGGGIYCERLTDFTIVNTVFSGNVSHAVHNTNETDNSFVSHCLFFDNPDGDYYDYYTAQVYTGAMDINLNVREARDTISGNPMFMDGWDGNWSVQPEYNPVTHTTTLTDLDAGFTDNELAGMLINPNTNQMRMSVIIANSSTTLTVLGDLRNLVNIQDPYEIHDYHLQNGSAAIDRAALDAIPLEDFEGDARPGEDGLADVGIDESPDVYQPPADMEPPVSYAEALPPIVIHSQFDIPYRASDTSSGVEYVELYYNKDQTGWTRYGSVFTESPISFDTTQTGGEGAYAFYTIATDGSGNVEAAPESPDATTTYIHPTPTPTPTRIPTATPTPSPSASPEPTVTMTPTPACDYLGTEIMMPSGFFHEGDDCYCAVSVCNNTSAPITDSPLFVILDCYDQLYFLPSFTEFDYYQNEYAPHSLTTFMAIPSFKWPHIDTTITGINWYAALTDPGITEIIGRYGYFSFGGGP